jgi:phage terminase large subunit GpA-like protein
MENLPYAAHVTVKARSDLLAEGYEEEWVSGLPAGLVPATAEYLSCFVDAGKSYLFYAVAAWSKDFTGSVIEYGTFPQQQRRYFSKHDAAPTIASHFAEHRPALAGANEATMLAAALDTFLPDLLGRTWKNADGDEFHLKRILCDTGDLGDVVCAAIGRLGQAREKLPIVMPSYGVGLGATKKPMSSYAPKPGDIIGWHWQALEPKDRRSLREVRIDTNHWKSCVHQQFRVDRLLPGSLTLYGDKRADHGLIADHLTAELPKEVENRTDDRRVIEWRQTPGRENEGLDCLVGCAAAAAMLGAELAGAGEPQRRSGRKRRPIGELLGGKP